MLPPGHEPFLRAICADPEDDTVRLVYADWLDENGDPDRAEHIRLTLAAHRDPCADHKPDPRFLRAQELVTQHRKEWAAELPGPALLWDDALWWHAGFPAVVSVVGREILFLRHIEEIVTQTPARALVLAVLSDPPRTLAALGDHPSMRHFRSAFTARTYIGDAGAEVVANGPNFAGLQELHLSDNRINDIGALALARSPYLNGLKELHLQRNNIGPEAAEALRARFGTRVFL